MKAFSSTGIFFASICLFLTHTVFASELKSEPKIGLVLGGGGARGAAHIGVLKVLEKHNIPISYIAGTSMGAVVGGFYASGMSVNEIEHAIIANDWQPLFQDRPPRADRSFRRKNDDNGFLVDFDMGVNKDGLIFPKGLVQGQNLELALKRYTLPVATIDDFDQLPIPFRAMATDLESGEAVAIKSGDLATAIRASMSLPGIFKPVQIDGRVLADGGIVNNLPIQIVRDMGADILIVVDVGFPLREAGSLDSALAVSRQMLTIMIINRTREQIMKLKEQDVLISPELGDLDSQDFQRLAEAMNSGEIKARELTESLSALAAAENKYVAYRQRIRQGRKGSPIIDRIAIQNESRLSPNVIKERISDQTGQSLDIAQLESDIANVYGFDTFESVNYSLLEDNSGIELLVKGQEKSWGPHYLQFGINLEDDFSGSSDYNLAARLTSTELNRLGGEFRAEVRIGESPSFFTEFYQPLDYASRWFINPSVKVGRSSSVLFSNGRQLAKFRNNQVEFSLQAGRQFGNWGEFRLTLNRTFEDASVRIGNPSFADVSTDTASFGALFSYDTIDNIAIPKSGSILNLSWLGVRKSLGSDFSFDISQLSVVKPQTWGKHTLLHWWNIGGVSNDKTDNINAITLGGLFSLSGYAPNEVSGRHGGIGRLLYYYRLGEAGMSAFDTPIYLGASVEAGYVDGDTDPVLQDNLIVAGSVFVVMDTIIGPLYLAYGMAEHARRSAYLFLGQTF